MNIKRLLLAFFITYSFAWAQPVDAELVIKTFLTKNQYLKTNDYLVAQNGLFFATMQADGNFCVYKGTGPSDNRGAQWCYTHTAAPIGDYFATMQADGNFCVYKGTGPSDNRGAQWCTMAISKSKEEAGFFNIGHMTNTPAAVDWAITNGSNAIEVDLNFNASGIPVNFQHGIPCDCSCITVFSGVCNTLRPIPCKASTSASTLLNHLALKKELALVVIDSKVSTSDNLNMAGTEVIKTLDEKLFGSGYGGNVIVGMAKDDTLDYLMAAAKQAATSRNAARYYFSIDQLDDNAAGAIDRLVSLKQETNNRVYGTGISACSPKTFYDGILTGYANQRAGVVGSVYIWTIDKESSMEDYIRRGVQGIITNRPDKLNKLLTERGIKLATPGSYIPPATSDNVIRSLAACDCDYHPGGCSISKLAPPGLACDCSYRGGWTCRGENVACLNPDSTYCKKPDATVQSCVQGGGDCQGYSNATCDCDYHRGGCTISKAAVSNTACRCKYKGFWTCGGDIDKCSDFYSPYCSKPDMSMDSCLLGGGDCGGY